MGTSKSKGNNDLGLDERNAHKIKEKKGNTNIYIFTIFIFYLSIKYEYIHILLSVIMK